MMAVDLVVASATTPAMAFLGESAAVSWTDANLGIDPTTGRYFSTDRVYLSADATIDAGDRILYDQWDFTDLEPGATQGLSANVTIPADLAAGSYYLIFVTDANAQVAETDEANNSRVAAITLRSRGTDLAITSVVAPPIATRNESIALKWDDYNVGTDDTNSAWL